VCDGQIVAHVSHDGGARKRFNKEGIFIESILTNKSHRSKGVTAKMLQYFMASSKTVKKVWFELDPKKYSVEDHPIAKHFLDWTRESEAVTKEKYKKSDYLTDGFTLVSLAAPCASGGGGAASSSHQNSLPTSNAGGSDVPLPGGPSEKGVAGGAGAAHLQTQDDTCIPRCLNGRSDYDARPRGRLAGGA